MLTTKKVIEDAIKVREDELKKILSREILFDAFNPKEFAQWDHIQCEIHNFQSQIAELKQSLKIIYDANKGTQKH